MISALWALAPLLVAALISAAAAVRCFMRDVRQDLRRIGNRGRGGGRG
ncbi:hypothetical protein L3Q65_00215 (plasmid) [Amycolatopsis sp. FU40]|nr:hypothetical protein [Amycolatopsis sp. FU40]UKD50723.1 hypothetical protein L3Q65_00215 [Amycolatopsis sp. FU40]